MTFLLAMELFRPVQNKSADYSYKMKPLCFSVIDNAEFAGHFYKKGLKLSVTIFPQKIRECGKNTMEKAEKRQIKLPVVLSYIYFCRIWLQTFH